ncbi:MAG TPA: adenylate/guanylate cyclase domain-containing protein [Thermoplasmata archaeon]|nr:adenylate/guanylate cyclase domain-containing protein [Thermoplasmata archaeon]
MADPPRRLAAIMFTDIVGYSALAQADEAAALAALERHNALLRPIFQRFHGREVKTVGDAFLVEFASALEAVQCAVEIQQLFHEHLRAPGPEPKLRLRIGIHLGDVVDSGGDILGDAVNIASRLHGLAEPEGICFTQQVFDQIQNKVRTPTARLPAVALKNIRFPMALYRVVPSWEATPSGRAVRPAPGRNLAVLPLANISPDPHDEYFADGLTEELISVLSGLRELSVIARTSVAPYKATPKPISQVGAELGVDTVLEGSVRKAGNKMRITLQLIDVPSQTHIWAGSYNRELDDVFAVQSDIAERTAEALRIELTRSERADARRAPTGNLAAYDCYLRGLVATGTHEDGHHFEEAQKAFQRATELDPNFAEAYAAWANTYVLAAGDSVSVREVMPRARALAARALELDPDSSEAHAVLGNIALQFDHDWEVAEREFRRAIELNPSNVTAHQFYGLLLLALERFGEARDVVRRAIVLDPSGGFQGMLSWAEIEGGSPDAALEYAQENVARHPDQLGPHLMRGFGLTTAGRLEEARRESLTPIPPADGDERFDLALLRAMTGQPELARQLLPAYERGEGDTYVGPAHLAMLYSALGEREKALDLLEQDRVTGDAMFWLQYRGAYYDNLRDHPRFLALLRAYRLPEGRIQRPPAPRP